MKLNKLLERLDYEVVQGSDEIEITTLINDSRKVENGSAFVCISGAVSDPVEWLSQVSALEQKMDDITEEFRKNQIARMRKGGCSVETSILYSEMLTDFERIGDHMLNIAQAYDAMGRTGADQTAAAAG